MKETIVVTVLVEIDHDGENRERAVTEALTTFTRDGASDVWGFSFGGGGSTTVGRSRAIQARKTKQRISPRKATP